MRARVIIAMILIAVLCFSACSTKDKQGIEVCTDQSMLTGFYEEDGIVHFICRIKLRNHTAENQLIKIRGISQEDVDGGLLENPYLIGYNFEDRSDIFLIDAKSQDVIVVDFCGMYAGVLEKKDRLIPNHIEIEIIRSAD